MTEIKDRLVEAAKNGEWLHCTKSDPAVPAELVRELLLGREHELDPRGVRLSGARIEGTLDLSMATAVAGLHLYDCMLDGPIHAMQARLPHLILFGGRCAELDADGAHIGNRLFLRGGLRIAADNERGAINLLGAHVAGDLELSDVHIRNTAGPVLNADGMRVDGALFMRHSRLIASNSELGAIRLLSARIGGNLELIDMDISNSTGPALDANGIRIDGSMLVRNKTRITGNGERGSLNLLGAHVSRNLDFNDVEITNTGSGPALLGERLQVAGSVFIVNGTRATGHGGRGAINLVSARVGSGGLFFNDVEISNVTGPALQAERIQVDGSLFIRNKIRITGRGERGAINLMSTHIATDLDLEDAELTNTAGPALRANRARVDGGLLMRKQLRFAGNDEDGTVVLNGAQIGGWLGTRRQVEMKISAEANPLFDLRECTVGTTMALPPDVVCPGGGTGRTCEHEQKVWLDEFSYASLGPWSWQRWLHVIRCHTPAYHASAYQRLAAVERAAGHDGNVRKILIAQQDDLRRDTPDAVGGWTARLFHRLWGFLAGYGYAARRTAVALLIVLGVAGFLGWVAGQVPTRTGHHAAERVVPATTPRTDPGVPCSTVELVGLGLDRGLPLGMIGMRTRCDLDTSTRRGSAFTWAIWLVQVLVWGLATLALAGYTNLVRKPG